MTTGRRFPPPIEGRAPFLRDPVAFAVRIFFFAFDTILFLLIFFFFLFFPVTDFPSLTTRNTLTLARLRGLFFGTLAVSALSFSDTQGLFSTPPTPRPPPKNKKPPPPPPTPNPPPPPPHPPPPPGRGDPLSGVRAFSNAVSLSSFRAFDRWCG